MFVCSSQDMGDKPRESRAAQCDLSDATWKLVQKKKIPAWSQGEDVTQSSCGLDISMFLQGNWWYQADYTGVEPKCKSLPVC